MKVLVLFSLLFLSSIIGQGDDDDDTNCTSTVDCDLNLPICINGVCSGCTNNLICAQNYPYQPYCNITNGTCQCESDDSCGPYRICQSGNCQDIECSTLEPCMDPYPPICDSGRCKLCQYNIECSTLDSSAPYCNKTTGVCVECKKNAHCPSDSSCDRSIGKCMHPVVCQNSLGCTDVSFPICSYGYCTGCWENAQCENLGNSKPYCHPDTNQCVECISSRDCGISMPKCFLDTGECIGDCDVSDWSDWSDCDNVCGMGTRTKTRTTSGSGCPPQIMFGDCNLASCECETSADCPNPFKRACKMGLCKFGE